MSTVTPHQIKTLVESAVLAIATPKLHRARWIYDQFGQDTDHLLPHGFSVGLTTSGVKPGRQRVSEGILMETTVQIRWAIRLKADAMQDSYDLGLDVEVEIIKVVRTIDFAGLTIIYQSSDRYSDSEFGFLIGTITFMANHCHPL